MTADLQLPLVLFPLFFLVAGLYSSVGHGGASGYLALFSLFGVMSPATTPIVLLLNILVASISFMNYWKSGHFSLPLLLPFAVTSIPAAYVGGMVSLDQVPFQLLLGGVLLLAALRLLLIKEIRPLTPERERMQTWAWGLPLGVILGFLSGLIGIGGGIFLSPLLLFLGWADVRKVAAVSSAFIVLNSLAGLLGHLTRGSEALLPALPLAATVAAGALVGSYAGAHRIPPRSLQVALGLVLILAAFKLIAWNLV